MMTAPVHACVRAHCLYSARASPLLALRRLGTAIRETADLTRHSNLAEALKPAQVVKHLDNYIVGQPEAKRAVAIAMRNRWRRHQLKDQLKNEVIPKNILMIGPTGCGKTEIARRIAKLSQAPFIKVEATKYTEVGIRGKDVDQIIQDLLEISIVMTRKRIEQEIKHKVPESIEDQILDALVGLNDPTKTRETWRTLLREGQLDSMEIDIKIPAPTQSPTNIFHQGDAVAGPLMDIVTMFANGAAGGKRQVMQRVTITKAKELLGESAMTTMLEDFDIVQLAIQAVEESGIVFIDEIDKVVGRGSDGRNNHDEGVQRDLLPIIEGCSVSTKHGNVNTDFILFIASGAFHSSKPSDLLAELQGRLPIRVTLKGLSEEDLYRILTEPVTNLIRQQVELMKSENVSLEFTEGAIRAIAKVAFEVLYEASYCDE